jgi:hypothetical protein
MSFRVAAARSGDASPSPPDGEVGRRARFDAERTLDRERAPAPHDERRRPEE